MQIKKRKYSEFEMIRINALAIYIFSFLDQLDLKNSLQKSEIEMQKKGMALNCGGVLDFHLSEKAFFFFFFFFFNLSYTKNYKMSIVCIF